jgi:hypothetical protein
MVSPDRRSYPGIGMELPNVYGSRVGIDYNILEAYQPRTLRAPARYITPLLLKGVKTRVSKYLR